MKYVSKIIFMAATIAFATSAAEAASTKKSQQMSQNAQIEARHQCFLEAQAKVPGAAIGGGEMSERTAAYTACAQRRGVRP
jgi:hypothetical protein